MLAVSLTTLWWLFAESLAEPQKSMLRQAETIMGEPVQSSWQVED